MYKPKDCVCEVGPFKAEQLFVCLSSRFTIRPPHCEDAPLTAAAPRRPGLQERSSEHAHADTETHKRAFRLRSGICVFKSLWQIPHVRPNLGIMSNLRWNWCERGERSQVWNENRKKIQEKSGLPRARLPSPIFLAVVSKPCRRVHTKPAQQSFSPAKFFLVWDNLWKWLFTHFV